MVVSTKSKKCLFVVGPTASGKSRIALKLAQEFKGAIVNGDSLQVFTDLNKGTAKPSDQDFKTRPHYLFNLISLGKNFTAGDFRTQTLEVLKSAPEKLFIITGGSGFYLQALEKGMFNLPKADAKIMTELKTRQTKELPQLYKELCEKDPDYAKKISCNDSYRIIRALEINISQKKNIKDVQKEFIPQKFPYPLLKIGLNISRDELFKKITIRTENIIKNGLIEEVTELLAKQDGQWPPLCSVGYKETQAYLKKEIDLEGLKAEIIKNTMRLAKRQMTWFRKQKDIQWVSPDSWEEIKKDVQKFLQ